MGLVVTGIATGDRGQRYEVRYEVRGQAGELTLGWAEGAASAGEMASAWALRPSVASTRVVDRRPGEASEARRDGTSKWTGVGDE